MTPTPNGLNLPWVIGYENIATGEITIKDSQGQTVARLGASHSPEINAKANAHYIVKQANKGAK